MDSGSEDHGYNTSSELCIDMEIDYYESESETTQSSPSNRSSTPIDSSISPPAPYAVFFEPLIPIHVYNFHGNGQQLDLNAQQQFPANMENYVDLDGNHNDLGFPSSVAANVEIGSDGPSTDSWMKNSIIDEMEGARLSRDESTPSSQDKSSFLLDDIEEGSVEFTDDSMEVSGDDVKEDVIKDGKLNRTVEFGRFRKETDIVFKLKTFGIRERLATSANF